MNATRLAAAVAAVVLLGVLLRFAPVGGNTRGAAGPTPLPTAAHEQLDTPTPEESTPPKLPDGWQKAFVFWDRSVPFGSPDSLASLSRLRDLGANTVSPVITWYVASPSDPHLHPGSGTAADEDLVASVEEAHRLGLRVVLRLHVDCEDGSWRAYINPDDKEAFFAAYGAMLNHYAELAQAHGVEGLMIGTELAALTRPAYTGYWQSMIANVRERFKGFLTYSAQWGSAPADSLSDPYREFEQIGFWRELDYLGISAYFELTGDGQPAPTIPELRARWEEWLQLRIAPFQARYGMPLLFTEVGYRSANGAARHPWDGTLSGGVNLMLQAQLYSALFETWSGVPWFHGAYFWFWPTSTEEGGPTNIDYPPTGKPAEGLIRLWYEMLDDMEQAALKAEGTGSTIPAPEGR